MIIAATLMGVYFYVVIFNDESYLLFIRNSKKAQLSNPLLHKHQYKFLLNNQNICDKDTFLVICVSTDPQHINMRNLIRQTWGSVKDYNGARIRVVFFMGERMLRTPKQTEYLSRELEMESERFQDIVKGNFVDSYRNLTFKSVMGLHWVHAHCRASRFIVKTDDDVFVNIFKLVHFLQEVQSGSPNSISNFLYGKVNRRIQPKRNNYSKWYTSEDDYSQQVFPPYCNGIGYVFSGDVAKKIYKASERVPYISIEDVYIGFCAKISKVIPTDSFLGLDIDLKYEVNEEKFISLLDWSIFLISGPNETRWWNSWRHLVSDSANQHSVLYYRAIYFSYFFIYSSFIIIIVVVAYIFCKLVLQNIRIPGRFKSEENI